MSRIEKVEGDYVFTNRPKVKVFSLIFKITSDRSDKTVEQWATNYGLDVGDIVVALREISPYGDLRDEFHEWLENDEDEEECF